jgi:hypothetical protein
MPWRPFALIAAATIACGCGGTDRAAYVRKNVALLQTVPRLPGAHLVRLESAPYKDNDTPSARTIGYGTTRIDALPPRTTPSQVVAFYRRKLRGWRVVDTSSAPSISLRKGDAYLHVLPGRRRVFLELDHDCYKGSPSPRCFGP